MLFILVGFLVGYILIETFTTVEREKNGAKGWNHNTPF